jgi:pheromone shutdown protein TraB
MRICILLCVVGRLMEKMELTIVPVAHISKESAELVRETIEKENPQLIGLELCRERFEGLAKGRNRAPGIRMLFSRPTTAIMFVAQQIIGKWWKIKPGEEMVEALRTAAKIGKPIILLDRPIRAIAKDIEKIPLKEKFGMVFSGGFGLPKGKATLKQLMKPETINRLLLKMEKDFPATYSVFVDSRNRHMLRKLVFHKPESAVIVVGAAHVPGILKLAKESEYMIKVKVAG